jgi:demethylmenaquinone methyltransferase/2-methoxy-6-polyprenyl-1,4-benzoquinol methylase
LSSPPATDPNRFARDLFTGLPDRYDLLAEVLSFGQNGRWRRAMVDQVVPAEPGLVLDVAAGTAGVTIQIARRTFARVVGIDLTEAMLRRGYRNVTHAGLHQRIDLTAGRAEQLPFPDETFDALTFTYLLRYVDDRAATMRELARVVRPGGRIGMLEFGVPSQPVLRAAWRAYTRIGLPAIGRLASPAWYEVGRFLGPSIEGFAAQEPDLPAVWRAAGIADVREQRMSFGAGLLMWGVRDGNGAA